MSLPLVLVPGLLCTAEVFAPQIPALWPHGPIVIAGTLEGDTLPEMAERILAIAPPRFALAGISMGGYLSLELVRRAPERVAKLALLDTSARKDTDKQTRDRRAFVERARSGDFETLVGDALTAILHPAHRTVAKLREINLRMALTIGVHGMARQQEAIIRRVDSLPFLPAISVPTLVLVGDSDALTPPSRAREMVAAIPNAQLVVVPQCGHVSTLEQPELVNHALSAWLTS